MTDAQLDALEAAAEAATPGPTMKAVDLTDITYPCATYALRRVGSHWPVERLINFPPEPFFELNVGDVLVWDVLDSPKEMSAYVIDEHGRPISRVVAYNRHFGVFEGDGVVSDVKFIGELVIPNIRVRRLSEMARQPTGRIPLEVLK